MSKCKTHQMKQWKRLPVSNYRHTITLRGTLESWDARIEILGIMQNSLGLRWGKGRSGWPEEEQMWADGEEMREGASCKADGQYTSLAMPCVSSPLPVQSSYWTPFLSLREGLSVLCGWTFKCQQLESGPGVTGAHTSVMPAAGNAGAQLERGPSVTGICVSGVAAPGETVACILCGCIRQCV